ncbi:MAG: hypothetical protein US86_C0001G0354 [Candidatus Daviesbacteria bacterium GW2011_GWA2_38_24]|uniref:Large ribosomal subunit protein uL29 n=1 Tax=Candidatus Daviesbacteria bacterium GW2011_GWA2_38_24 TaxID=1618422 RepID=A0A0G0JKM9_9BACT|nr:MAG: hypothetical protein US86_C0001G0354 [Candidatus Daviesbacteria bacterium GW2011_GWA2_38_24]KKQ78394.1 MAG: hypothetical protein UT01_C0071G0003 [Candidatus Daviesbacteria bacterium GW2011_GWA1_38_7]OGE24522.1 MAG: 50S ribosomal protein L29 [Candidatus Daviesbacteria bacterium RIFCSPHIGHO2_01_FULL_38_8]
MRKNELSNIKGMNIPALNSQVQKIKKEIADLGMDKNMNKLKDLKAIRKRRKDVAQILTVIAQKELLEQLQEVKKGEK